MWLLAQMKGLDDLIKELYSVLMCPESFSFIAKKKKNCATGPEKVPKVKYFRKFITDSNKQGHKLKSITSASYIEKKVFFLYEIFAKYVFLDQLI